MAKVTLTHEQEQDFKKRYEDGSASLSSIAVEIGCSIPTVSRRLRKLGVVIKSRGRPQGAFGVKRAAQQPQATNVPVVPAVLPDVLPSTNETVKVALEEDKDSRYSW